MSAPHGQKQIPTRVLASLRTARNDKVVGGIPKADSYARSRFAANGSE